MRRVDGRDAGAPNSAFETINAAAAAIASAENRAPQTTAQKKRWGSCWSMYWCFGYHKQRKRIGHAVLVPETSNETNASAAANPAQIPTITLPFVAPPSSPVSFLQTEPPSVAQSPTGILSLTSISANMYSPSGPASIFAIGPYAHETQLVSPPAFSTFTTEPSTAPFTPPPESVHLTTPSSPEVPFAQLLDPHIRNGETYQRFSISPYDLQFYQLHPGSPIGQIISPTSGISPSGNSSPFPDHDSASGGSQVLMFKTGEVPKLLNLEKLSTYEWGSRPGSGSLTPDAVRPKSPDSLFPYHWFSESALCPQPNNGCRDKNAVPNHRVSFELTKEDVLRCREKQPVESIPEALLLSQKDVSLARKVKNLREIPDQNECHHVETSNSNDAAQETEGDLKENVVHHQKDHSITLSSVKEFNFGNPDGSDSCKPNIGSDWWANEKVAEKEIGPSSNWSFFPMMQPGVS